MPDELSPSQAAARIGATTRSVQRWIAAGQLPARRVGGRWRVAIDALDAFAAQPQHPSPLPGRAVRTLFIANRGEIAARIRKTCETLGIRAITPETEGPDGVDLLDAGAVVDAGRMAGADALHPGFGFLAENAEFAGLVMQAGIAWIGPPPDAIRTMGDKAAARRLAERLGIPVVPGYDDSDQTNRRLAAEARRIGYPVLVKPALGGGGKGMRVVRDPGDLEDSVASARREASASFGDDRLILERLLEGPRHIEIQILFDAHGKGVQLGERDCSIQRRHQKILEETPSPAVDERLRRALGDAALHLASAVGYVSAGTCEFLVDDRDRFYFLEMNTRLQVEHPVTEMVTGRDLVADQIRIAAGETLGFEQADVRPNGHAVEVRLYAEDAEAGFLPATGRVEALRWPAGEGIRVDAGIEVGTAVGGRFDPMLAKVIAHGADRQQAIGRLTAALDETTLLGLVTNLRFLRWLVRQPAVVEGRARIDTLDRIWPPDDWPDRIRIPSRAWSTAAAMLAGETQDETQDPWSGGWRLNAPRTLRLRAGDEARTVTLGAKGDEGDKADEGDVPWSAVRIVDIVHVDVYGRSVAFELAPPPDVDRSARAAASHSAGAGTTDVVAPMPGSVINVHVSDGDLVETGVPIVTLEAMKMEHVVTAPSGGRVDELSVARGDQVTRGQLLATIEPAD